MFIRNIHVNDYCGNGILILFHFINIIIIKNDKKTKKRGRKKKILKKEGEK